MSWLQIRITSDIQHSEIIEALLLTAGSDAVTIQDAKDQAIYEPRPGEVWDDQIITGLFTADSDMTAIVDFLKSHYTLGDFPSYKIEILEDKDWVREWMTHFEPMRFGKRLWVCPSWKPVPDENAANLMLDPGLAFGTGTHPTTALCLRWLDQQDLEGKLVVDFGCGSGILGIAALLLGAKEVIAVDNDPQALDATADNTQRNKVDAQAIHAYLPEDCPETQAEVLVANILAGPLTELRDTMSSMMKPGALLALSGILSEQAEALHSHYAEVFDMDAIVTDGDWVRLSGVKR